ncbi:MAG: membrane protein insertion efficiency factor YidD [Acidobacteriota bacterium]
MLFCASLATPYPLRAEIAAVRFYRAHLSYYAGFVATCRYRPTCSLFALEHLESDGFWLGNVRVAKRLAMCSPVGYVIDKINGTEPEWQTGQAQAAADSGH